MSAVFHKNNSGCGSEFDNRIAVAVVEKCAVVCSTTYRVVIHNETVLSKYIFKQIS